MYSKITIFCDNEAELREFAERILSKPTVAFPEPVSAQAVIQTPVTLDPVEKPARKPRADAGKPRGPYKTTTTGEPAETVQQDGTDKAAALAPAKSELPATPTTSAAAGESVATKPGATPPAPVAAEPTLDDARAALARINAVPGLGMEACLAHLAEFGTDRITLLKKEHYARFITAADAKVAAAKAKK